MKVQVIGKPKIYGYGYSIMNTVSRNIDAYPCSCTHQESSSHRP